MIIESKTIKVQELIELKRNNMLTVNAEYQRGSVWSQNQQRKLIDSILRGYPLPLIYVHYKKRTLAGMQREDLEIIDGQQRINAMDSYANDHFHLFDPEKDDKVAKFPKFIKDSPCEWARKKYSSLDQTLKERFDNSELVLVKVITDVEDEARDLFIRLQAGLPLNAQEKRDAWPGNFTDFILRLAGKPELGRYPGHDFFRKVVARSSSDRGAIRQLCAQIAMLFLENAASGNWIDIGTQQIDEYYYANLSFDVNGPKAQRLNRVLDLAFELFDGYKGQLLKAHEAIHIVLLIDSLINDYTKSWQSGFTKSVENFRLQSALHKKAKDGEYWSRYLMYTQAQAANSKSIESRHKFFAAKMFIELSPIKKDPIRLFGQLEREIIYYRDEKKCAVCSSEIVWKDLEIHHIDEHQDGGHTILENGIAVHSACHPKGQKAIEFNTRWKERQLKNRRE